MLFVKDSDTYWFAENLQEIPEFIESSFHVNYIRAKFGRTKKKIHYCPISLGDANGYVIKNLEERIRILLTLKGFSIHPIDPYTCSLTILRMLN